MKKTFYLLIATAVISFVAMPAATARNTKKIETKEVISSIVTKEFKADIHCEDCAKKVMNTLPYQKGVKDVDVDIREQMIVVKYDSKKTSTTNIIKALSKVKVDAQVYYGSTKVDPSRSNTIKR